MTALMYRLQTMMKTLPLLPNPHGEIWPFSDYLNQQSVSFFRPLLKKHLVLTIEYSVLCAQLSSDLLRKDADLDEITEQVASALMMSELLAHLYRYYLNVPREVERLRKDQLFYQKLLKARGFQFATLSEKVEPDTFTQKVRTVTAKSNWLRLFVVRSKRFVDAIAQLLKRAEDIKPVTKFVNPALSYLSWLFFIPRLAANMLVMGKHFYPSDRWMSKEERALGVSTRLQLHFQRRWFELGNDSVWLIAGLLNCFVLVGPLAPVGAYMTTVLFAYDILLAAIRASIELGRLERLRQEHVHRIEQLERQDNPAEADEARRYLTHLDARILFEKKRLLLSVANTTVLFLAMVLTVPFLASFGPFVPLIAGALLVTITIAGFLAFSALEKQRPADNVAQLGVSHAAALARLGLFSPDVPQKSSETPEHDVNALPPPEGLVTS
ncbi:hypothetical protein DIZ81_03555 [Legionella taurinensis]|uniref:Uncharacterized protein n=1 Tax=Legionella taurinensis TaxID=70611 RepID=A0A3A5LFI5_9GAMM|nr:hypothetical protein [Legionella taurinensis]MDX1836048.1 hypothetical protein [Legionella taurinensis]PUT42175.1 hypothetical protein DB744_03555 [Legionella taurinensis]PUT44962.1 hypothetical protein DB746_03555 [Legionella taurinensis]PUT48284.1 hypothetical protein DB743_01720 [Legionella taurinensis]PUT49097.1 hypothetical protein DB745_03555 [Legionella taurinensis]